MKIKKADWVVIRLLREAMVYDTYFRNTPEVAKALQYLLNKYGNKKLKAAIDLIKAERSAA